MELQEDTSFLSDGKGLHFKPVPFVIYRYLVFPSLLPPPLVYMTSCFEDTFTAVK